MEDFRLQVSDMKCEGCVSTVREALQEVDGVLGAEVTLEDGTAKVQAADGVPADDLVAAVEDAGYGATEG